MYERFTDRARKVMELAGWEARRFNHEYIGTEHILLGLVKEDAGVASNVTAEARSLLLEKCPLPGCGAWSLRHALAQLLEAPLADELLKGALAGMTTVAVRVPDSDGQKRLQVVP